MYNITNETIKSDNYQKFKTRNPIVKWMIKNFYGRLTHIINGIEISTVIDAGCGEGESIERLQNVLPSNITGFDISESSIMFTKKRFPLFTFAAHNIYDIPYEADSSDLVLCLEVFEHLEHPEQALLELLRIAKKLVLVSVPYEPYFRIGNLMRGKYISHVGNHPKHIQHWNRRSLTTFLKQYASDVHVEISFPWLIGSCRCVRKPGEI